ncbi:ankyrin repeat domain-containing protein [Mycolicibacterium sp. Dal123E01]|uniref:ankyrin repeat domain-containing protein n=1 Tax=Mycolicibacterium sp. Dal123E01 TaxID=3457578 RepID=UPI00403E70F1
MARSGRPPKIDPLKPIHRAVMDGNIADFSVELTNNEDNINLPGPEGMTPLHIAADRGNVDFARALLDAGAAVDPINVWGNTPLWVAVMKRRRTCPDGSMIHLLVEHGADPHRGGGDVTPLGLSKGIAGMPEDIIALLERNTSSE